MEKLLAHLNGIYYQRASATWPMKYFSTIIGTRTHLTRLANILSQPWNSWTLLSHLQKGPNLSTIYPSTCQALEVYKLMTSCKQQSSSKAQITPFNVNAPLLAIHTCACPKHPNEPIPCKDMEVRNKLKAEAGLEEHNTILGWLLDTQRLLMQLPENKFTAWTNLINMVIWQGLMMAKEIESIIGCLGHLGMAIPFVRHFLSRLWDLHTWAKRRRLTNMNKQ